jgi:hypothetical protein
MTYREIFVIHKLHDATKMLICLLDDNNNVTF